MKRRYLLTLALFLLALALVWYGESAGRGRKKLEYAASLDKVALVVEGESVTLRALAYYVAIEEEQVQKQAVAYDPIDTRAYWNVHEKGTYIRVAARNAAIQMAIHDVLFAKMSEEDGITLNDEEYALLASVQESFWQDLVEDGKAERLGVSFEDICDSMERAALAQKYQDIYEQLQGVPAGAYNFDGADYGEYLTKQEYKIVKDVWERIDFGNVTLTHES